MIHVLQTGIRTTQHQQHQQQTRTEPNEKKKKLIMKQMELALRTSERNEFSCTKRNLIKQSNIVSQHLYKHIIRYCVGTARVFSSKRFLFY